MSESTIRGTIKNFSPKPNENYYGLQIDKGNGETTWINGQGNPEDSWSKGDQVKVKVNKDEFIDIQEIIFLEDGDSRDTDSSQNAQSGEGNSPSSPNSKPDTKDDRINKKVAFKEAVETVRNLDEEIKVQAPEEGGEHVQTVSKVANGYYNILKNMGGDTL